MIAANGVTRAVPRARSGFPSLRRVLRVARALGSDRRAGGRARRDSCPPRPTRARSTRSSRRREPIRTRFPDLSLAVVKLLGLGRVRARAARARAADGHFGLAVQRLHALHRAQPPLSRSRHAAPAQSGARRRSRRPTPTTSWRAGARTAPSRRTTRTRSSGRCASRRRRCCSRRASASASMRIVTGASDKGTWVRISRPGRPKAGWCAAPRASTSAIACSVELSQTDAQRGFIDFARCIEGRVMMSTARRVHRSPTKNKAFLDSDDARPLRILAEYLEPLHAFGARAHARHDRVLRLRAPGRTTARSAATTTRRASWPGCITLWSKSLPSGAHRYVICTGGGGGHHGGGQSRRLRGRRPGPSGSTSGCPTSSGPNRLPQIAPLPPDRMRYARPRLIKRARVAVRLRRAGLPSQCSEQTTARHPE